MSTDKRLEQIGMHVGSADNALSIALGESDDRFFEEAKVQLRAALALCSGYDSFVQMRARLRPWLLVEESDANGLDWQTAADAKFSHQEDCNGCDQDRCEA